MDEKEWYVIFRCRGKSASGHEDTFFRAYLPFALERGLFDWSGGREVLAGLRHIGGVDVYCLRLTDEEAWEINQGAKAPPPKSWQ